MPAYIPRVDFRTVERRFFSFAFLNGIGGSVPQAVSPILTVARVAFRQKYNLLWHDVSGCKVTRTEQLPTDQNFYTIVCAIGLTRHDSI